MMLVRRKVADRLLANLRSPSNLMNGKISTHPFAELLREISQSTLSGAVRLEHERARAAIYFEAGQPVFAASNLRELRLAEYLTKRNLVSPNQLAAAGNNRADTALAEILCSSGVLEREVVDELFTSLVTDVLRVVLLWSDGSWVYDDRMQLAEPVRVTIATRTLLLEGARKIGLKLISSRFPDRQEIISPPTIEPEFQRLLTEEAFVLSRVDRPTPLSDIIMISGQRELDALRTIYGLALADYLQRERWPSALDIKPAARRKPPVTAPVATPVVATPPRKTEEQELAEFFERMDNASSYYDVLNVSHKASMEEIKRGYYTLARRFHPDRFHSRTIHGRIEAAFARITQAHETLMDPGSRSTYDSKLSAQERSKLFAESAPRAKKPEATKGEKKDTVQEAEVSDTSRAETNFKEGYAALKLGQINAAVPQLAAAAQAEPGEARYRAFYGQALAMQGKSQRLAELELHAAIRLDQANASYRLMLANLYFELEFFKRAQSEAERVLSLDPENAMARELLRKLETS